MEGDEIINFSICIDISRRRSVLNANWNSFVLLGEATDIKFFGINLQPEGVIAVYSPTDNHSII